MQHAIKRRLGSLLHHGLALMLLLVGILSSFSRINAAPPPLTWPAAVQEAARNNAEFKAAEANRDAAGATIKATRAGYLPQISASLTASRSGETSNRGSQRSASLADLAKTRDSYGASLEASETLFNGFATQARLEQSKARLREAEEQLQQLKARLSAELKTAFADMQQAQKLQRLYRDIIQRREENMRLVSLRYAAGQENKGAVRLSEAYLQQARFESLQARNDLGSARARLNRILGRNDSSSYEVAGELPSSPIPNAIDFASLARNTPDYRLSEAQEATAKASLTLANAGFYPQLGLRGSIGRQDETFFPQNESWTLSLTLTIPLFSGGSDYYSRKAAVDQLTASSLNRQNNERQIIARLQEAHAKLVESEGRLKVDESFREAVTLRAEIARSKYNNGLTSFDDWDLIENDLINRQRAVLSSQGQRVSAEAAWEQAQGKGAWQ